MRYFLLGLIGLVCLFGFASSYAADQAHVTDKVKGSALRKLSPGAFRVTLAQTQPPQAQDLQSEIGATGKCEGKFNVKIDGNDAELCPVQYKLNVPEEATDLLIELEKGGKFDMSFALAFKDPVGTPEQEFFVFTRRGSDIFNSELGILDRDAGLKTGLWYIGVVNYEEKSRDFNLVASNSPTVLQSGQSHNGSITDNTIGGRGDPSSGILGFVDYTIRVPEGSASLTIETKSLSGGDIDLFARFDKPVDIENRRVAADHASDGDTGNEKIVINDRSRPALRAGIYYIKIGNFENKRQSFVLTAAVVAGQTQPAPAIRLSTNSLNFSADVGGRNPATQQFQITNSGGGTLNWKASSDQPWLSLDPASGTAPATVNANVNIAGLAAGTQRAKITVSAEGANNSPQTVDVALTLTQPPQQPPTLQVRPAALTFNATVNGANPAGQTLEIANTGGGLLNWTAVADVPWLSLSANSGAAPAPITVNVNIAGLAAGTLQGRIIVSAQGANNSPQQISVTLVVAPPAQTAGQVFAVRFSKIEFPNPEKWERTVKDGCVVYKNISNAPATVKFILNNGSPLDVEIPAGKEIFVCGAIAHIDTRS
jgi:hypothetical protein